MTILNLIEMRILNYRDLTILNDTFINVMQKKTIEYKLFSKLTQHCTL